MYVKNISKGSCYLTNARNHPRFRKSYTMRRESKITVSERQRWKGSMIPKQLTPEPHTSIQLVTFHTPHLIHPSPTSATLFSPVNISHHLRIVGVCVCV